MSWIYIVASFAFGALLTSVLNWLALGPFRRAAAAHWTERARLLWPVRQGAALGIVSATLTLMVVALAMLPEGEPPLMSMGLACAAGGILGMFVIERTAFPRHRFLSWLVYRLCLVVLLGAPILLWVRAGMAGAFGVGRWPLWATAAFLSQSVVVFGLWQWPLRWLGVLQPGSPELAAVVRELSATMQVPVRHVWETAPVAANALASPWLKSVIVSRETMKVLDAQELRSLLAHELGHLAEPRHVSWLHVLGSFWTLPLAAMPWLAMRFGLRGFLIGLVASIVWLRLARWLSRVEERRADAAAARVAESGEVAAQALENLHEAGLIPATYRFRNMTHPPLYDRMLAAGVTPSYDRPPLPKRMALNGWLALIVWIGSLAFQITWWRTVPHDAQAQQPPAPVSQ